VMTTEERVATGLAFVLVALAIAVESVAVITMVTRVPALTEPGKADALVVVAALVAAGMCVLAVSCLRRVWRGLGGWPAAFGSYALALVALFGLLFLVFLIDVAD